MTKNVQSWYRALPKRRKRGLWLLVVGTVLIFYAALGLNGVVSNPLDFLSR